MLRLNFILSFIFFSGILMAQNGFQALLKGVEDCVAMDSKQVDEHFYFPATKFMHELDSSSVWVYKMSETGELIDSVWINTSYQNSLSYSILENNDTLYVLYVNNHQVDVGTLNIAKLSKDFQYANRLIDTIPINGRILIVESNYQTLESFNLLVTVFEGQSHLYDIGWNGKVLKEKHFEDVSNHVFDICYNEADSSFYSLKEEWTPVIRDYCIQLDDSFNVLRTREISIDTITLSGNILALNSNSLLAAGRHYIWKNNFSYLEKNTGIFIMDSSLNIKTFASIGSPDTIDISPLNQFLVHNSDDSKIFLTYTKNYYQLTNIAPVPTWISVVGLDNNLNILWHRFYGGDFNYYVFSMIATSDGGVLINATQYDWNTQYNERDALLLKLNSDGLLTSTPENPTLRPHHAIVYPNPGHGVLKVEAGPQIFGATFELFDMGGQRVARQTLQTSVTAINTAPLTSGGYPWRIVWKGEVVEEGKWVKE